jgi:F0F1-type ATP synthase assembly protein I
MQPLSHGDPASGRSRARRPVNRGWAGVAAEYLALAFLLPASTFVGYFIGYLLDRWLGTNFLYIVFLVLGIVSGFVKLIQQLNRDSRSGRI